MYRESQHYLALIRFPTLWGLLYMFNENPETKTLRSSFGAQVLSFKVHALQAQIQPRSQKRPKRRGRTLHSNPSIEAYGPIVLLKGAPMQHGTLVSNPMAL